MMNLRKHIFVVILCITALVFTQSSYAKNNFRWKQIPIGGEVLNLFSCDDSLYAGVGYHGLFKSHESNGKLRWEKIAGSHEDPALSYNMNALLSYKDSMYAATGSILFSPDKGTNWGIMDTTILENIYVYTLFLCDGEMYAGTKTGVFKSSNGKDWIAAGLKSTKVHTFLSYKGSIYVGTEKGVFKTSDRGKKWKFVGLKDKIVKTWCLHNDFIYVVDDEGVLKMEADSRGDLLILSTRLEDTTVRVLLAHKSLIYAGTEKGVFKTSDGGVSWVSAGLEGKDVRAMLVHKDSVYAVAEYNVFALQEEQEEAMAEEDFESEFNPDEEKKLPSSDILYKRLTAAFLKELADETKIHELLGDKTLPLGKICLALDIYLCDKSKLIESFTLKPPSPMMKSVIIDILFAEDRTIARRLKKFCVAHLPSINY